VKILEKKKWVARLERGKYLVIPLEAGSERLWSEEPYLVANALVDPAAIAYWSAIRHWNWTEQLPRIIYVQTTRRKKATHRVVFGVTYEFVTVNPRKFYGHITEWRGSRKILITCKEKTLLDCADDLHRCGGIEELVKAVKEGVRDISWPTLRALAKQFPNRSALKRLGFLVERLSRNLPEEALNLLDAWQSHLSAGVVPLEPGGPSTGKINTRWRVRVNAEFE
jgi:predicted transcriptional regulator of viral defense system